jgi:hypothetical protein
MINAKIEKIQGKYGAFDALVISGETLPIMNQLKSMGFRWYGAKQSWWISNKNANSDTINKLKSLGVVFGDNKESTVAPTSPDKPLKPAEVTKKQWVTEDEDMTRWYGFPINKAIMSYKEKINVDNKEYDVDVTVDRSYVMGGDAYKKTKSREYKGKPKYLINVSVPELNYNKSWKKVSKQLWGSYDEDNFLNTEVKDIVKKDILEKAIPNSIRYINDLAARTPEYRQFLKDIEGRKITPEFNFHIEDPEYKGDYKIKVDNLIDENSMHVYLSTNLNTEGAPRSRIISHQTPIDHTFTVEDFYRKIQENIDKEHDKIQEKYIEYLKSFPYLSSQKQEATRSLEDIKSILQSPQSYVNKVFDELKNRGYIRPHKRQKQYSGLTMGDEIKWIIDSKKIVNDSYSASSYLAHTPEYFYAVVAYYIHRVARNIQSWTDMMLVESMMTWKYSMKSYGIEMDLREIERVVSLIGSAIYRLFSKDVEQEAPQYGSSTTGVLKEFSDFAIKHGISIEGLEDNVRNIYRSLAKNLHPDTVQDPIEKQEKTKEFQQLQNIYDALPQQYKTANNWYDKYVESQIQKDIIVNSMKKQK